MSWLRRRSNTQAGRAGQRGRRSVGAVDALRDTWSRYPSEWKQDPRLNMGFGTLGEEWGGPAFADYIVACVGGHLGPDVDVLELGCGGGKFSQRLAPCCRTLLCTDISQEMIEHARNALEAEGITDVDFHVLNGLDFTGVADDSIDFIFSYDVLLHLQPQNVFSYMLDARRVLRDRGVMMLHQINLASVGGISHFLGQYAGETWKRDFDDPRRRGHIYFTSQDQMRALAEQAGLEVEEILSDSGEFRGVTADRDLIGLLRKSPSRLKPPDIRPLTLVKTPDDHSVFAVIDGTRLAFSSAVQFERAGLEWDQVRHVSRAELEAIPDGGVLEAWE